MSEKIIALPRGRSIGYREYGDPNGRPVINCHGGLLCGLDVAPFDQPARDLGLRIVSPDRPGIGASDPSPGRTTGDWSADVRELLDALDIESTAIFGWSMGGQYALACAARLTDRVTRTVCVAGCIPIDEETLAELNATDRRLTRLAQRQPTMARAVFASMGQVACRAPGMWARGVVKGAPPNEAEIVKHLPHPGFADAVAVALAHGHGMVEEYRAWVRPWGFALEDIQRPVVIWQGDDDVLVPASWGAELARRIPGALLIARPNSGHFVAYANPVEVLRDLLE